jgi:hypothetical protein
MAQNYGQYCRRKQEEKETKDEAGDRFPAGFGMKRLAWRCRQRQIGIAVPANPGVVLDFLSAKGALLHGGNLLILGAAYSLTLI